MFLKLTDRFGQATLVNMSEFTIVAETQEGGCKLYPGNLNERYHGVATLVGEGLSAFRGLHGFIAIDDKNAPDKKGMLVNMQRIARVVPGSGGSYLDLAGNSARIETTTPLDDIVSAMGAMIANRPA